MRKILSSVVIGFAMLAAVGTASAAQDESAADVQISSSVVINEVTTVGPNGALDEAIEIRNISSQPVDISGYLIGIFNQANAVVDTITVPQGVVLAPKGNVGQFLVLTGQNFSGTVADQTNVLPFVMAGLEGIPSRGGVAIFNMNNSKIDGVAFSATAVTPREGVAAQAETVLTQPLGAANARDLLSTDRDHNQLDFSLHQRTLGAVN
ncbi:lamin tail domain-containing protein [Amycolatopsis nigrescens]|uniref:lamin tail domain-containing protein n=1 Tax=Amycolatopsis nigrescens TaxID=381445 RepID=UPI00039A56A1|nr:lamin tail domain-containing protein [Amycolatopsis nigrescens]